ncbi:MAG: hypothetical protein GXP60_05470 [Epsilonproteobacteria bacterium]|nr:hypothetical protein [Campylobacterota bacterium]
MNERIRYPKTMMHRKGKSAFEKKMENEGWEKRAVVDGQRVDELRELYEEMGFEVLLVPVSVNGGGLACDSCFSDVKKVPDSFQVIYTKKL